MSQPPKIMVTGHRPQRLGGFGPNPTQQWVRKMLRLTLKEALKQREDIEVISGMALGVDQWWAKAALDLGIPYHAYIPFEGQESRWPEQSVKGFEYLLLNAKDMKIICEGGYAPWKMQKRNEAMVDDAEVCVAVWDGAKGGTGNCVEYIIKQGKPLFLIDPVERKRSWYVG